VSGACLAMVSLVEFIWFATISANEDAFISSEDIADQPMPADLLAALIQMLTFVSCDNSLCIQYVFTTQGCLHHN